MAGKQGAEGTESCVTSCSLLSLLPSPTGPCPLLGGGTRTPATDWGRVAVKERKLKTGKLCWLGNFSPCEGDPDIHPLSRGIYPQMGVEGRSP